MIREYRTIKLTEEDRTNLRFLELTSHERKEILKESVIRFRKRILIYGMPALVCFIFAKILSGNEHVGWFMTFSGSSFLFSFLLLLSIFMYRSDKKMSNSENTKKLEGIKLKSLPIEKETIQRFDEPNAIVTYYPIIFLDTMTNYSTKLYVGKNNYYIPDGTFITNYEVIKKDGVVII